MRALTETYEARGFDSQPITVIIISCSGLIHHWIYYLQISHNSYQFKSIIISREWMNYLCKYNSTWMSIPQIRKSYNNTQVRRNEWAAKIAI